MKLKNLNNMKLIPILLPTEEALLAFCSCPSHKGELTYNVAGKVSKESTYLPQHLYLISKEAKIPTKWYYDSFVKDIRNTSGAEYEFAKHIFPIVATTDPKLIAVGVLSIDENTKASVSRIVAMLLSEQQMNKANEVSFLEEFVKRYRQKNNQKGVVDVEYNFGATKLSECYKEKKFDVKEAEAFKRFTLQDLYSILAFTERETRHNERGVREFVTGEVALNYRIVEEWLKKQPKGIDLKAIEKNIDESLAKETPESMTKWLNDKRKLNIVIEMEMEVVFGKGRGIECDDIYQPKINSNGQPILTFK